MRLLIAEDDAISRRMLEITCRSWGFDVQVVEDGEAAWRALAAEDAPPLALLDWMMPGMEGVEVIRRVRGQSSSKPV
jgi:phosphoserine phosphatase RsbU/P